MMSDEKKSQGYPLQQLATIPGRNILPLESKLPLWDDEDAREEIQRMAEVSRLGYAEMEELGLIHPGMKNMASLNAFRELRTNLYQSMSEGQSSVVLVTALCPGGGSSYVTLNLGAAIALDESKTSIVVDCNVYDPSLHRLLPVDPDFGLVDYLEDTSLEIKDVIYATGVRRLRILPGGTRRQPGTEYFTSGRMRRLVQELRSRYRDRHVIIDAPSIGASTDARILAELCDLVVLVVPFGKVTQGQIAAGIEAIGRRKLAGIVFDNL